MATTQNTIFHKLNAVDVSGMTEQKMNLSYLSWAQAWKELKNLYPKSYYTIYEDSEGIFYHTDGRTCWVKTGVTVVDGDFQIEHIEYLPVMNYRNQSIPVDDVTSFDVNSSIQRSLTKAVARHGLGLSVYTGEDIPDEARETQARSTVPKKVKFKRETLSSYLTANQNKKKIWEIIKTQEGFKDIPDKDIPLKDLEKMYKRLTT